jgi:biopolymer transport protein ExbB/TolQ
MAIKIKPEIVIVIIGTILLIAIIWLIVLLKTSNNSRSEAVTAVEEMVKAQKNEKAAEKLKYRRDSISHVEKMDSAQSVYNALEKSRRNDFYFFQKQLNDLKKINTYSRRLIYLDSLERAVGLR